MKKQRKHYTPEEKVAILRRHLLEQVPISELCDKHGLQPTVFYRWQKEFFENGAAAFQPKARPNHSAEQERIDYLEKKIQTKDEVLAELMAEHVALKKNAWGTLTGCDGQELVRNRGGLGYSDAEHREVTPFDVMSIIGFLLSATL